MPVYLYHGISRQGVRQFGEVVAHNHQDARRLLRRRQLHTISLREKSSSRVGRLPFLSPKKVSGKVLVAFTHQLATMIKAGIPILTCLEALSGHSQHPVLRVALEDVHQKVEGGSTLADAFRSHPVVFPESYIGLVEAGEAGGMLDAVLERLARYHQQCWHVKNQVQAALAYPSLILCFASLVFFFLLLWVIPTFASLFSDFGAILPWPTELVLVLSQGLNAYLLEMFLGGILLWGLFRYFYSRSNGRMIAHRVVLRLPMIGGLLQQLEVVQVTRTLGSLLRSGVPILEALTMAAKASGNVIVAGALREAREEVGEGQPLGTSLSLAGVFPLPVLHMISVGESTGALDFMLEKISELYEEEVQNTLTTWTSMIEPLIIMILGVGIGFIVIAMYLPIFTMSSVMGNF